MVWWDFLGGGDGVRMKALIADFNKEHPDIQIEATTLEWGVPFYTKVRTSAGVGEGPDVMTYHLSRIPIALDEGVLSPITDEDLANAGVTKEDFFPRSIEAATRTTARSTPCPSTSTPSSSTTTRTCSKGTPYLDADGKLTGINNLDDFNAALKALKDKGVETPLSLATGNDGTTWRIFATLLAQQGGQLIVGNEVLPGDNADKAVKAIQIIADWRDAGYTPEQTEYPASVALFSAGERRLPPERRLGGPDLHRPARKKGTLGFDWSATVIPTLMGAAGDLGRQPCLRHPAAAGKEMDPAKRKAVMEVIGWMEKHALRWADAGHIPAYLPVATSAEYKAMEPNASYAPLADTPPTIRARRSPASPRRSTTPRSTSSCRRSTASCRPRTPWQQIKEQLQPLLN